MSVHKFALDHKRAEHFLMPANKLIIIGLDTDHVQGQHPLWRADARAEPDARLLKSVRKHGYIQPVRARKIDFDTAEVVVGRERVKVGRILEIPVPCLLWPKGATDAEIIGAANAENYQRKQETVLQQAEHVYMQLMAEGFGSGVDEKECMLNVEVSTGFNPQRQKNLLAFREDAKLVQAVMAQQAGKPGIGGEAALAIATLPKDEREKQLAIIIADPNRGTVVEVRERVAYVKASIETKVHNGAPKSDEPTGRSIHDDGTKPAKPTKPTKTRGKGKKTDFLGFSKSTQRRIVEAQMAKPAAERDLDQQVIKAMQVTSGLAAPSTVAGMSKVMKDMDFEA